MTPFTINNSIPIFKPKDLHSHCKLKTQTLIKYYNDNRGKRQGQVRGALTFKVDLVCVEPSQITTSQTLTSILFFPPLARSQLVSLSSRKCHMPQSWCCLHLVRHLRTRYLCRASYHMHCKHFNGRSLSTSSLSTTVAPRPS